MFTSKQKLYIERLITQDRKVMNRLRNHIISDDIVMSRYTRAYHHVMNELRKHFI